MSAEALCPHCGRPLPPASTPGQGTTEGAASPEPGPDRLLASGSIDEGFAASPAGRSAPATEPDPILGEFVAPRAPDLPTFLEGPGATDPFPAINLTGPRPSKAARARADLDEPDDDDAPRRATSWPLVLLGSYASALTLVLAWSWLGPKPRDKPAAVAPPPVESRTDPGLLADRSRRVEPPGPIPADRIAKLGQTLKVGSLEVTPVDVGRQDVTLRRSNLAGLPETRRGGRGALVLRVRLRNLSGETAFAPVDPAFVRERGREIIDTYIESADGGRIYPFPLAVESEWSIAGQDFADLRPGETRVVALASAPDAPGDDRGPFTWRVRLRTGIDRTDVIGVRWSTAPATPSRKP